MTRFLALSWIGLLLSATIMVAPGDDPGGLETWTETEPPKHGSGRWREANYSKLEWVVTLREGRPQARLQVAGDKTPAPLPFKTPEGSAKEGLYGRRLSIQVDDGWIVAFDAGEFGAGLWWFSPDGKERHKIAEARVRGFFPTESGLLALEGLAHLSTSKGRILRLARTPEGRWQSEDFVDLKHAPEVGAQAADGSLIVATTDRLLRVVPATKEVEVLLDQVFWGGLYPNSMAITPRGVIYLGMRQGVAKVEPKGGPRRVRWLLPGKAPEARKTGDARPR